MTNDYYKLTYTFREELFDLFTVNEITIYNNNLPYKVGATTYDVNTTWKHSLEDIIPGESAKIVIYVGAEYYGETFSCIFMPDIKYNSISLDPAEIAEKEYLESYRIKFEVSIITSKDGIKFIEYDPNNPLTYTCQIAEGTVSTPKGTALFKYFALTNRDGNYVDTAFNLTPLPYVVRLFGESILPNTIDLGTFTLKSGTTSIEDVILVGGINNETIIPNLIIEKNTEILNNNCLIKDLQIKFSKVSAGNISFRLKDNSSDSYIDTCYYEYTSGGNRLTKNLTAGASHYFNLTVVDTQVSDYFMWDETIFFQGVSGFIHIDAICTDYVTINTDIKLVPADPKWTNITLALVVDSIVRDGEYRLKYVNPPKLNSSTWLFNDYEIRYTRVINNDSRGFHWDSGIFTTSTYVRSYGEFISTTPNDASKEYANLVDENGFTTRSNYVSFKNVVLKYQLNM